MNFLKVKVVFAELLADRSASRAIEGHIYRRWRGACKYLFRIIALPFFYQLNGLRYHRKKTEEKKREKMEEKKRSENRSASRRCFFCADSAC